MTMISNDPTTPFYKRFSFSLLSLAVLSMALYYGSSIILPILCAILTSNLLLPAYKFFAHRNFGRVPSIVIPLILSIVIGGGVFYFLSSQVINFLDDLPALKDRIGQLSVSTQGWINENAHIAVFKQNQYIYQWFENLKDQAPDLVGGMVTSVKEVVSYVILVPTYTFLMLYYKRTIKSFLIGLFKNGSSKKVNEILNLSSNVAQHYVSGLLIETAIVFILNLIGFILIGIKYTVFLALLVAVLNLIPYMGIIIANILCLLITLVSSESIGDSVWVAVVIALVQVFDNNFGMPLIVGNKVRINALVTLVGILIGGTLCGIPGMFLAIPAIAVMKIICDKIPDLRPWGILLGDETPRESNYRKAKVPTLRLMRTKQKISQAFKNQLP
jgi:predicted PurR-regulated permease PerM